MSVCLLSGCKYFIWGSERVHFLVSESMFLCQWLCKHVSVHDTDNLYGEVNVYVCVVLNVL